MAQKRRDSDLSSELYFSVYGNNRKLKPQKIKTYALYKPLLENTTANNFVVAVSETNEIFVSFKEGLESKVFTFDKVFCSDIPQDDFYLLYKSAIQDVIMGLNSILFLCKVASPATSELKNLFKMDLPENIIINVLKELLLFVNKEENMDCSLHVSHFEIHGDKLIDHLSKYEDSSGIIMYENPEKDCIEIKGLVEKALINDEDIIEFINRKLLSFECSATCCHLIIFASLVRRNINSDGLEFIKTGKLTMVSPADCKNSYLGNVTPTIDDCLLNFSEYRNFASSCNSKVLNILKPVFEGKVTTTVIVLLSSVLYMLEKDLKILQFVSDSSLVTHPEINLQLIIRNSTKEYADEIKELQKDLDSTSKGTGVRIDHLLYRSLKNSLALENEKVKNLEGQVSGLTDSINLKKQQIMSLHAALESKETEIKEIDKSSEVLKLELKEMKLENVKQKVSLKAGEIVDVKQKIISNELYIKKLKLQLIKENRNYDELTRSIHFLKNEMTSFICDIDAQNTSQKSTLELLIVDMNNTFEEFQALEKDLTAKLNCFLDIDVLIMTWKDCMENMKSSFSCFIHEKYQHFTSMEFEMSAPLAPHHSFKDEIVDIIKNDWSEKGSVLKYHLSKLQVFCDSSFKMLAEIINQMDVIENCYKAEFKAISTAFSSTNMVFKKFVNDISTALKSFNQYFKEQENELLKIADLICFHRKFKMKFNEKIADIKQSLFDLKQIYLDYNTASSNKWNQIQKDCQKNILKHNDLSDHLFLFQKEMSKCLDNLPQQKMNMLEYSPLKDKTNNVENRILQLLQIHKEIKGILGEAVTVHKKSVDKELIEIEKYTNLRKSEVIKYLDVFSAKLKDSFSSFLDGLRSINEISASNQDTLRKKFDSLSLSASYLESIYNNYLSTSNNILAKSERSFKVIPSVSESKQDNISDFESLFLEEWEATTSTPNIPEKKEFDISKEKEKLINRVKSLAEQQLSEKSNISVLDYEEKESKNTSTVSLPNFRTAHSKALFMTEKSFPRFRKK